MPEVPPLVLDRAAAEPLAVQLVATLKEAPTQEVQDQLETALGRLDGITDLQAIYDGIKTVEQEVITILLDNDLVDEDDLPATTT